ncbi:MAG: TetR/AcrR family transcriptional regulator [Bacteroidetes bacterium]|nr:TetR/AcrR family transcriptional regulator [Bacteroidota bacterium]
MRIKEGNKEKDILEAAIKVFAQNGFHQSTMAQISEQASVATGSIYLYFPNKKEILQSIFDMLWNNLFETFDTVTSNDKLSPAEKLDGMIDLLFDRFIENPSLAIVFVNEQNHLLFDDKNPFTNNYQRFLDRGIELVRNGIERKEFWGEVDLTIFKYFIFGAVRNLLHLWAQNPDKYNLNTIRKNVKYLMKHGLVA